MRHCNNKKTHAPHLELCCQRRESLQQRIPLDVRHRREVKEVRALQLAEIRRLGVCNIALAGLAENNGE